MVAGVKSPSTSAFGSISRASGGIINSRSSGGRINSRSSGGHSGPVSNSANGVFNAVLPFLPINFPFPTSAVSGLKDNLSLRLDDLRSFGSDVVDNVKDMFANRKSSVSPSSGYYDSGFGIDVSTPTNPSGKAIDYFNADLASRYGMSASTAYQEALSNTAYQR